MDVGTFGYLHRFLVVAVVDLCFRFVCLFVDFSFVVFPIHSHFVIVVFLSL